MAAGNVAYSILGRVGVVRAPSMVHPLMNVVRVDIIDIKSRRGHERGSTQMAWLVRMTRGKPRW